MDERYVEGGKRVMARRDEDSQGERIRHPEDADPVDEREYRRQLAAYDSELREFVRDSLALSGVGR